MACCGFTPEKSNSKNQQPTRPRGDDPGTIVVSLGHSAVILQASGQGRHKVQSEQDFTSSSLSTLQSQHVLLQI